MRVHAVPPASSSDSNAARAAACTSNSVAGRDVTPGAGRSRRPRRSLRTAYAVWKSPGSGTCGARRVITIRLSSCETRSSGSSPRFLNQSPSDLASSRTRAGVVPAARARTAARTVPARDSASSITTRNGTVVSDNRATSSGVAEGGSITVGWWDTPSSAHSRSARRVLPAPGGPTSSRTGGPSAASDQAARSSSSGRDRNGNTSCSARSRAAGVAAAGTGSRIAASTRSGAICSIRPTKRRMSAFALALHIGNPIHLVSCASSAGRARPGGISAPSNSTGRMGFPLSTKCRISLRTQSLGSRRRSSMSSQYWSMKTTSTEQRSSQSAIEVGKWIPG
jgi:hypothetical protein